MKKKLSIGILLLYFMSLIIACDTEKNQPPDSKVDIEQIKKEIQTKENEYAEVYNAGELKKIGYYADDAISYAQNQAPKVGREAIIDYLKVDAEFRTDKISFKTNEVFVSNDGNLVVEIGYYKVVDSTNTDINSGNYMCLFEKRDGKYYCIREMSASDMSFE